MIRLVVTGASGFLGQAVLRAARDRRIEALGVSRRAAGDWHQVGDYCETPCPEGSTLVHLAQARDAVTVLEDPWIAEDAVDTVKALLAKPFAGLLYGSSAAVYAVGPATPRKPTDDANASSPYAEMKRRSEDLFLERDGTVARLANLYGPGGASTFSIIEEIVAQLGGTGPIKLRNAKVERDFLHVDDAAAGLLALADTGRSEIYNLGTGSAVSIGGLAVMILEAAGQHGRAVEGPSSGPEESLALDITETTVATGWGPRISLLEGLGELLADHA